METLQTQLQESVAKPIQNEFCKLKDTIDTFRGQTAVSSSKGQIGELTIEKQIETYFPDCELLRKSKEAHQSDFHLKLYGYTVFIEAKAYQKNVPHKEVEKFFRDISENPDAHAGIMYSLSSGIANKPNFCYEICTDSKKPVIFVPNSGDSSAVTWPILFVCLVLKHYTTHKNVTSVSVDDTLEIVNNQLQWVKYTINNITQLKELSKKHYTSVQQQHDKFNKDIQTKLEEAENILQQHIQAWTDYISNGKKVLLPLPSDSQNRTGYKCNGCGKQYKQERTYLQHANSCALRKSNDD
jgi:gas vesicle protein